MTDAKAPSPAPVRTIEFTILMASMMSIVAISIDALLPALGVIGRDLKIANPNHAQFLISSIFLGSALGQLVAGPLSDALGRRRVLYAGIGLYFIGSVVCYFASSLEMILIGRVIQGLGVSGPYVSTVSIVRDKYAGRDMARMMSFVMMIFIMVPAIAPSLGQAIMYVGSWRAIFLMYIAYALVIAMWVFFRLEETLPPERRIPFNAKNLWHALKEIVRHRATLCYTVCMGVVFGSLIGYLNSCQQIFQVQFGVGEKFALYFGGLALVIGAASLTNAKIVEKFGMRYICLRSFMVIVAVSSIFLALHLVMPITLWMFLGYAAVLFFSFGLVFGNLNALAMEPMGHIAGTASAVIGASSSILSMVLGSFIGQLYDNTLIPVASGFLCLGVIATGFMLLAGRRPSSV